MPDEGQNAILAAAKQHPGVFGLACRLRGRLQADPATDEMAKAALWLEIDEATDKAREMLLAFPWGRP